METWVCLSCGTENQGNKNRCCKCFVLNGDIEFSLNDIIDETQNEKEDEDNE